MVQRVEEVSLREKIEYITDLLLHCDYDITVCDDAEEFRDIHRQKTNIRSAIIKCGFTVREKEEVLWAVRDQCGEIEAWDNDNSYFKHFCKSMLGL